MQQAGQISTMKGHIMVSKFIAFLVFLKKIEFVINTLEHH